VSNGTGRRVDTVIVGGGIAGTALAYYLARGGVEDIVLLERDQLGSGMTAASFSGVRQQFSTPLEIELSKRGLRFWKTCEVQFDSPCPFDRCGYLLVTSRLEVMQKFAESAKLQRELGAGPVTLLSPGGVNAVAPWLVTDDLAGGSYTPEDGRVTGTDGVAALAKGARSHRVDIRQWSPVTAIERRGHGYRVIGPKDTIDARRVVVAAGLWSPVLLKPLGLKIDVFPLELHYALTTPALEGCTVPLTIDFDTGFCIEREGPGLVVSMLVSNSPPGYGQQEMLENWFTAATRRAPTLVNLGISHVLSAPVDEVSDGHPNAGRMEEELWVLAGFAGHGVMHGPVLAELLARTMLGDPDQTVDLEPCNPLRTPQRSLENEWMATPIRESFVPDELSESRETN
jgi:sarcosine oxidase subunit beta